MGGSPGDFTGLTTKLFVDLLDTAAKLKEAVTLHQATSAGIVDAYGKQFVAAQQVADAEAAKFTASQRAAGQAEASAAAEATLLSGISERYKLINLERQQQIEMQSAADAVRVKEALASQEVEAAGRAKILRAETAAYREEALRQIATAKEVEALGTAERLDQAAIRARIAKAETSAYIENEAVKRQAAAAVQAAITANQAAEGAIRARVAKAEVAAYRIVEAERIIAAKERQKLLELVELQGIEFQSKLDAERLVRITAVEKVRTSVVKEETAKRAVIEAAGTEFSLGLFNRYTGALRTLGFAFSRPAGQALSLANAAGRLTSATGELTTGVSGLTFALGGLALATGGIITLLYMAAERSAEYTVRIARMSAATGATTQQLSGIALAAKQMNIDLQTVERSMIFLSRGLGEGNAAGERFRATIQGLGIHIKDAHGALLPFSEVLPQVIERLGKADAGSKTLAQTMNIMSRSTTEQGANISVLLRVIERMPGGLQGWIDKARELGLEVTPQLADQSLRFKATQTELYAAFQGLVVTVGREVIPVLQTLFVVLRNSGALWEEYKLRLTSTAFAFAAVAKEAELAVLTPILLATGQFSKLRTMQADVKGFLDDARQASDDAAAAGARYDAAVSAQTASLARLAKIIMSMSGEHLPDLNKAIVEVRDRLAELVQKELDEISALEEGDNRRASALNSYYAEIRAIDAAVDAQKRHHRLTQEDIDQANYAKELAEYAYLLKFDAIKKEEQKIIDRAVAGLRKALDSEAELRTKQTDHIRDTNEKYIELLEKQTRADLARADKLEDGILAGIRAKTLARNADIEIKAEEEQAAARWAITIAQANAVVIASNIQRTEAEILSLKEGSAERERAEANLLRLSRLQIQANDTLARSEKDLGDIVWAVQNRISASWELSASEVDKAIRKMIADSNKVARHEQDLYDRMEAPITARVNRMRLSMNKIHRDTIHIIDAEKAKFAELVKAYQLGTISVQQYSAAVAASSAAIAAAKKMEQEAWRAAVETTVAGIVGIIAGVRAQAAVMSAFEIAEGIKSLALHQYKEAALHFAAAVEYGLVAGGVGQGGGGGKGAGTGAGGGTGFSEINPATLTPAQQQALLAPGTRGALSPPTGTLRVIVMGEPNAAAYLSGILNNHVQSRDGRLVASHAISPTPVSRSGRP